MKKDDAEGIMKAVQRVQVRRGMDTFFGEQPDVTQAVFDVITAPLFTESWRNGATMLLIANTGRIEDGSP